MKKSFLIGLTVATFSQVSMAGSVNEANMTTFGAGSPAVAAEVNGNFAELISAINDNATRIAALETQVGGGDIRSAITGASFKMSYLGHMFGVFTGTNTAEWAYLQNYIGSTTITLNEGGSFTQTDFVETAREIGLDPGQACNPDCVPDFQVTDDDYTEAGAGGTWTLSGSELSLLFADDTEPTVMTVTANGQVFIGMRGEFTSEIQADGSNSDHETNLIIGVRVAP